MARKEFRDLTSPAEARETIRDLDVADGTEPVPLADARGRVLADRIDAEIDVPGFDRASMDGYAVRARDTVGAGEGTPIELDLVGSVHAGEEPTDSVGEGEAVEVGTGAVLLDGADAVVIVERTEESDGAVAVHDAVTPGENVMPAGADVAAGRRTLGPGTHLTSREIGLLSALGIDEVPVRRPPKVGVISTGDELVPPGDDLRPEAGQIYDVNSQTIAAGIEEAGGEAVVYARVGDDRDAMESTLERASDECDLVLTSGSTSASAMDVVYRVVEERGERLLHGIAVKPGKPTIVGRIDGTPYVGLPGYPVSALTIFRTFVAPGIRDASGLPERREVTVSGRMAVRERYEEGRLRFVPVGLVEDGSGETLVYPVDKGSGATTSLVDADGVVAMDPDVAVLSEGETVEVELFSPDVRPPRLLSVGEDDPLFSRLLDRVERPRHLPIGTRHARRRLRDGVPDVAVVSGPNSSTGEDESEVLDEWSREWGLVVPPGNPAGIEGLADVVDGELTFANLGSDSGLRASLEASLDDLAESRDADRRELETSIEGFDRSLPGVESPARRVEAGDVEVGFGLRATADRLDLGFVSCGTETVRVLVNPDRDEKSGVADLTDSFADVESIAADLPGYRREE